MTNSEKYLKDGVKEEFIKEINAELDIAFDQFNVEEWLKTPCKPTLTEDERVILRNIEDFNYIERDKWDGLELNLRTDDGVLEDTDRIRMFDHLFQFIKERRRIFNKRIVGRWKIMGTNYYTVKKKPRIIKV